MKVEIYYCSMWNYLPQASRLEELKDSFNNVEVSLIASNGGTFQVIVNEKIIFDKLAISKTEAIFPNVGEISKKIKEGKLFEN